MNRRFKDISGQQFNQLTVIEFSHWEGSATMWRCRCLCDREIIVRVDALSTGNTKSCGCLRARTSRERMTIHGMRNSSEYENWSGMKKRCSSNYKEHKYYADRGIQVCERWQNSFEDFFKDMGVRPSPQHSIDRINNDKGYFPENCRWATPLEQSRNKRIYSNNTSGLSGVTWDKRIRKWAVNISVNKQKFWLGAFNNIFEAAYARKSAELKYWS